MSYKIKTGLTLFSDLYLAFELPSSSDLERYRARLFPNGNTDLENPTNSIFLASMSAVKEFREELFTSIGISKIKNKNIELHVFTELGSENKEDRPDGLIVMTSGKAHPVIEWIGFVEFKVGTKLIVTSQIERYIDLARTMGIENIITISNQLVSSPSDSPVSTKKTKFNLYHWSWTYLKVAALRLVKTGSVSDPDHEFILRELRRYFDGHKNINNYTNMGEDWRESVERIHICKTADEKVPVAVLNAITDSYQQEEKDISLQLTDRTNFHVELDFKKNRAEEIQEMLNGKKIITSTFILNGDKKRSFELSINFLNREISCSTKVIIDKGKSQAQTTALLKMFEPDPALTEDILVNANYLRKKVPNEDRVTLEALLQQKTKNSTEVYLTVDKSLGDEIKFFEIKTKKLLSKDFIATQLFIRRVEDMAQGFVLHVMSKI